MTLAGPTSHAATHLECGRLADPVGAHQPQHLPRARHGKPMQLERVGAVPVRGAAPQVLSGTAQPRTQARQERSVGSQGHGPRPTARGRPAHLGQIDDGDCIHRTLLDADAAADAKLPRRVRMAGRVGSRAGTERSNPAGPRGHTSSEMNASLEALVTSMHILPAPLSSAPRPPAPVGHAHAPMRTTGQLFLHSSLHFLGLHCRPRSVTAALRPLLPRCAPCRCSRSQYDAYLLLT